MMRYTVMKMSRFIESITNACFSLFRTRKTFSSMRSRSDSEEIDNRGPEMDQLLSKVLVTMVRWKAVDRTPRSAWRCGPPFIIQRRGIVPIFRCPTIPPHVFRRPKKRFFIEVQDEAAYKNQTRLKNMHVAAHAFSAKKLRLK